MENTYLSLLWPHSKESYSSKIKILGAATVDNLDLDGLCRSMTKNKDHRKAIKEILINICCDEDVIRYRQDIFEDLLDSEELTTAMKSILDRLEGLQYAGIQSAIPEDARLWRLFSRFKELEAYVDCVAAIRQSLMGLEFKSNGIGRLNKKIKDICEDEEFKVLSDTVKKFDIEMFKIQSISLGINLDSSLNPVEATLISVNKTKFKESWLNELFLKKTGMNPEECGFLTKIHRLSEDKRDPIMYHFYRDIEKFLKPVIRDMSASLNRYAHICCHYLVDLIPEIMFYLSFVRLIKLLKQNGMPFCKPDIRNMEDRNCVIDDMYNINLALHMLERNEKPAGNMVLNNVRFDEGGRILILTGPNRGGKTVYTEAVGLAYVLFQTGAFVPGTNASMSAVDSVFSHFPVDENQTVELGRLGEETKRLNEIFGEATKYSLILLNESLASTSFTEGLYIAQDIVKALRYLGSRVIFNTHMHELANYADAINKEVHGESKVMSLVAGLAEGKRSYVIKPGTPLGKSYAMDIAVKYGVSFEQIVETIDKNNQCFEDQILTEYIS